MSGDCDSGGATDINLSVQIIPYMYWSTKVKKVKVSSYIARYPVRRTAQSALHFTPWQTCSFQGHLNFSGKYSAVTKTDSRRSKQMPGIKNLKNNINVNAFTIVLFR